MPALNRINITEKEFRQQVIDLATIFQFKSYFTWSAIHSPRGMLDLILCRPSPPKLIFAELKSDKGKVTESQQEWIDLLRACNIECYVWRPADIEDIVRILENGGKRNGKKSYRVGPQPRW